MSTMRAKMKVQSVIPFGDPVSGEHLELMAVSKYPYGTDGDSEDNTYARYTPNGKLTLTVNNPALLGALKVGESYYLDFTKAAE